MKEDAAEPKKQSPAVARSLMLAPLLVTLGVSLAPLGLAATASSAGFRAQGPLALGDHEVIKITWVILIGVSAAAVAVNHPVFFRIWMFVLIGLCIANLWGCGLMLDDLRSIH